MLPRPPVPVQSLIDFLEGGETIDAFIKLYPTITREQVLTVLDFAKGIAGTKQE